MNLPAALLDILIKHAPRTRAWDRLLCKVNFRLRNGRWPGSQAYLDDALMALLTSDDIVNPLRVFTTDKDLAKIYIRDRVGADYVIPTLAVLRSREEIEAYAFPTRCVIKPTHSCGQVIVRTDGEPIDRDEITRWLSLNYYLSWREANYKDLVPKVIVEALALDQCEPTEYCLFCNEGRVRVITAGYTVDGSEKRMRYLPDWTAISLSGEAPNDGHAMPPPDNLDRMISVAEDLSSPIGLVRIDLYSDGSRLAVGEITHVTGGGLRGVDPPEMEPVFSRLILMPSERPTGF